MVRAGEVDIKTLYGISAWGEAGTKFRVYMAERENQRYYDYSKCIVEPCPVTKDPHVYNSVPAEVWDHDIFSAADQNRFLNIIDYIMLECAKLGY